MGKWKELQNSPFSTRLFFAFSLSSLWLIIFGILTETEILYGRLNLDNIDIMLFLISIFFTSSMTLVIFWNNLLGKKVDQRAIMDALTYLIRGETEIQNKLDVLDEISATLNRIDNDDRVLEVLNRIEQLLRDQNRANGPQQNP